MARPAVVERLHRITIPVMKPTPVMRRVDDGDVVISRELCKEILTALTNAYRFGSNIPRYVQRSDISDWADEVRSASEEAVLRLKRAAMAQNGAA